MSIEEYVKTLKYPYNSKFKKYVKALNSLGVPVSVEQYKIYIEYIKATPYARMSESTFIARYGEKYYYDIMLKQRADAGHSREKCIDRYGEILGNEKYEQHRVKSKLTKEIYLDRGYSLEDWQKICDSKSVTKEKYLSKSGRTEDDWSKLNKTRKHTLNNYIEKYGEIDGLIKFQKYKENSIMYGDGKKSNQVLYWTKLGYTEEESIKLVSERQSTFSLNKCITNYGDIEGKLVWQTRQDKWQETLKSKPKEEIARINTLKGLNKDGTVIVGGLNETYFKNHDPNHDRTGILYYIRFYSDNIEFWKIGITSINVQSRFGSVSLCENLHKLKYEILYQENGILYECFNKEQQLLKKYSKDRITINYNEFKSTECFNKDIMMSGDFNLNKME
jgi:hypothetical protein